LTYNLVAGILHTLLGEKMTTPFTTKTGIRIGSRYRENGIRMPIDDPDMLRLQRALLITDEEIEAYRNLDRSVMLSIAVILTILFYLGETHAIRGKKSPPVLHPIYDQGAPQ
jgi:hypothetical protein